MKQIYVKAEIRVVKLGDELLAPIIVDSQQSIDPGASHAPRYYESYFSTDANSSGVGGSYLEPKDLWADED